MEEIIQKIKDITELSDELELLLRRILRPDVLKKKQKLLKKGQICTRLYFIEKGLLRLYVKHGDRERTSWFMLDGDLATSVTSFFERVPSLETIEALEDCVLWSISWRELQDLYEADPRFRKVGQYFTEKYYCQDDRLKIMLLTKSPAAFFDYLKEKFPKVVDRVPKKYLASSMGITTQTLGAIIRKRRKGQEPEG